MGTGTFCRLGSVTEEDDIFGTRDLAAPFVLPVIARLPDAKAGQVAGSLLKSLGPKTFLLDLGMRRCF